MDKSSSVLIWNSFNISSRSGGPPTYIYNLNESISNGKDLNYCLDYINLHTTKTKPLPNNSQRNNWKVLRILKFISTSWLMSFFSKPPSKNYDILHFHLAMDVYVNRRWLKKTDSTIMLTPHSPELAAIEIVTDVYKLNRNTLWAKIFIFILVNRERSAFKIVDRFVFPCEEAREPYLSDVVLNKILTTRNSCNYALTCSPEPIIKTCPSDIRTKLNIPLRSKIICYAGRHNHIKGFDIFVRAAKEILKKDENVYIIVLGSPGKIQSLNHPRCINVGWTKSPHDYMNAADIFVLPNRSTYFDLILLESLSLGNFIVASYTGGNKFFQKFKNKDFIFYDNHVELSNSILDALAFIKKSSNKDIIFKSIKNREIYESHFSIPKFSKYFNDVYFKRD